LTSHPIASGSSSCAVPLAARAPDPEPAASPFARLIDAKLRFHHALTRGRLRALGTALRRERIAILPGFTAHIERVQAFFTRYYAQAPPRVALVGINPGRFGGGRTGLPFLDPPAVSALLDEHVPGAGERSARFLWEVIAAEGAGRFFAGVYVTNLSWFGFLRDGTNLNLDALPESVQTAIEADFMRELALVRPRALIPLGTLVARRLARMQAAGTLKVQVLDPLPHPRWCAFPSRRGPCVQRYRQALAPYLPPRTAGRAGGRPA
jgi:uracil-DNA glycosylase